MTGSIFSFLFCCCHSGVKIKAIVTGCEKLLLVFTVVVLGCGVDVVYTHWLVLPLAMKKNFLWFLCNRKFDYERYFSFVPILSKLEYRF